MIHEAQYDLFEENTPCRCFEPQITAETLEIIFDDITAEKLAAMCTNVFNQYVEYQQLCKGADTCRRMSLLFNPHRLDTRRKDSKYSVLEAVKTEKFRQQLAKAILWRQSRGRKSDLLYNTLATNVADAGFVQEFPPLLARKIANSFSIKRTDIVLDPCAGWGGRLIGLSTVCDNYTACEPQTQTFNGLLKLADFLKSFNTNLNTNIINEPYENAQQLLQDNHFDFAMTSPPYFDTELYSSEPTQSYIKYKTFEKWTDMFFLPLVQNTIRKLKPSKPFILNIGSRTYPLNKILTSNFKNLYIEKLNIGIQNTTGGLKNNLKEGESFYLIHS